MTEVAAATKKPRLDMSIPDRSITWGSKVKVVARVYDPATGKAVTTGTIRLQGWRDGAYRTWQSRKVDKDGRLTFYSKPGRTATMRVTYAGSGGWANAAKAGVVVTVKASGAKVLAEAQRHKGKRYVFGSSGPDTFDCSGYTMYVYRKAAGKKLPHKANSQQKYGKAVSKSGKRVGDLIVFRSGSYGTHVAIYAGGNYMWAAPNSKSVVKKQKIYSSNYVVRRLV
ncbi:C40 family peptidase [Spirilliplanes yamanashiensis]|nr:C40 family peptidase [Spirilliplanes yamanashiensis]MDP9816950.1 cell wall-associated NlpC family hydrolase [Spirilliplanes yamanashiensis]